MSDQRADAEVTDAVVLGAGVIGASVAFELARTGRRVLVLDKNGGVGHGSTSASSALIRFNYSTLPGVATAWESKFCWESWADHLGHHDDAGLARFHRVGVLHLDVPVLPRQRSLALLRAVGVPYEELEADEIAARFPELDLGRYWPNKPVTDDAFWDASSASLGGYLTPDGGYVDDPQLAAHNLAAAAVAHGATLRLRTEVCGLDGDGEGWLVRTTSGDVVRTPVVVNAAGPWSGEVNRMAGVGDEFTIGVRPMRQEVHQVPLSAQGGEPPLSGPAVIDLDLGTYMRTGPTGDFLVGGTEPECDPLEWLDDPDLADPRVTRERYEAQTLRAARRLPGLRVPGTPSGVAGVYDVAEDWTPIYDKTDAPGFFVAMGTSGNQFKNAPLAGRFLATIVEHEREGRDHDETPAKYVGEHTGQVIDLAAFSRKRPVNTASSGTVMG